MQGRERLVRVAAPAVIFLFTFAVFFPTLAADFVDLDDFALLIENDKWRGLGWENVKWMFTTTLLGHFQPLTWVSYGLTYELLELVERGSGMRPAAYHFGNVLLHAVNAVLVYLVGMKLIGWHGSRHAGETRLGGASLGEAVPLHRVRLAAGVGALVWAAHPLRVESVAWVTERRDVLSAMFLLLALLMYLKMAGVKGDSESVGSGKTDHTSHSEPVAIATRRTWVRLYAWSIGLLVLSLLSKPWGMSFFVVALVLDWYPLRRLPVNPLKWVTPAYRRVVLEKAPYIVLGGVFMVSAGMSANSAAMAMRTLDDWPMASRVAQAAYGLVFYVQKSAAPTDLAVLYELRHGLNPLGPEYLVRYAAIGVFVVLALALRKRVPGLIAAGVIYAALVAPVLGFFQSGDQFVADRYSYLATIGWALLFGAGVTAAVWWAERTKLVHAGVIAGGVGALVLTSGVLTMNQSMVWQNSLSLWEHAVKVGHGTPYVRVNYGLNLERRAIVEAEGLSAAEQRELLEAAVEQFRIAAELRPDDGKALFCMGNTLRRMGRLSEAAEAFGAAAKVMPQSYQALVNRGMLLIRDLGRPEEGLECLRAAVRDVETPRTGAAAHRPLSGRPYLALGAVLRERGDVAGAREAFEKARMFEDSREAAEGDLRGLMGR